MLFAERSYLFWFGFFFFVASYLLLPITTSVLLAQKTEYISEGQFIFATIGVICNSIMFIAFLYISVACLLMHARGLSHMQTDVDSEVYLM